MGLASSCSGSWAYPLLLADRQIYRPSTDTSGGRQRSLMDRTAQEAMKIRQMTKICQHVWTYLKCTCCLLDTAILYAGPIHIRSQECPITLRREWADQKKKGMQLYNCLIVYWPIWDIIHCVASSILVITGCPAGPTMHGWLQQTSCRNLSPVGLQALRNVPMPNWKVYICRLWLAVYRDFAGWLGLVYDADIS